MLFKLYQDTWKYNMKSDSPPYNWRKKNTYIWFNPVFISIEKNIQLKKRVYLTCITGLSQDEINSLLEGASSPAIGCREKKCLRFTNLSLYIWMQLIWHLYLFQKKWLSSYLLPSSVSGHGWLMGMLQTIFLCTFFFTVVPHGIHTTTYFEIPGDSRRTFFSETGH